MYPLWYIDDERRSYAQQPVLSRRVVAVWAVLLRCSSSTYLRGYAIVVAPWTTAHSATTLLHTDCQQNLKARERGDVETHRRLSATQRNKASSPEHSEGQKIAAYLPPDARCDL